MRELDRANTRPPPREATGDGEEEDVASRESMRLANHNGYSGAW
jgi:hypothetical protein